MNSPPAPFGDPTRVRQENSDAVRKGLLFGCGGCGLVGLCVLAFVGGIMVIVFSAMRSSDVCAESFARAQSSAEVKAVLGTPLEMGWFITGSVDSSNGSGEANLSIPISGPQDGGSIHAVAKKVDGVWTYSAMKLTTDKDGRVIDLLALPGT